MSDQAPAPGWWVASDGNWYPPEQHPDAVAAAAAPPTAPPPEPAPAPTPDPGTAAAPAGSTGGGASATPVIVGLVAAVVVVLALVAGVVVLRGGSAESGADDGGSSAAGAADAEPPDEVLPLNAQDRGCYDDDDGVGCSRNAAPVGTRFLDDSFDVEVRVDAATATATATGDSLNDTLMTIEVTLSFTNNGTRDLDIRNQDQFPWYVVAFTDGDSLDCDQSPRDSTLAAGATVAVTWTCEVAGPEKLVAGRASAQLESDFSNSDSATIAVTRS